MVKGMLSFCSFYGTKILIITFSSYKVFTSTLTYQKVIFFFSREPLWSKRSRQKSAQIWRVRTFEISSCFRRIIWAIIEFICSIKIFTADLSWKMSLKYLRTYVHSNWRINCFKFSMLLVKESRFMVYKKV